MNKDNGWTKIFIPWFCEPDHIKAFSDPDETEEFRRSMTDDEREEQLKFKLSLEQLAWRRRMIKVKCEVHPWEFAFIGVVDHPFFAVTGKDGNFKLPANLPAGEYVIEAIHPKAGAQTQTIAVGEQEARTVNFAFAPKKAS